VLSPNEKARAREEEKVTRLQAGDILIAGIRESIQRRRNQIAELQKSIDEDDATIRSLVKLISEGRIK